MEPNLRKGNLFIGEYEETMFSNKPIKETVKKPKNEPILRPKLTGTKSYKEDLLYSSNEENVNIETNNSDISSLEIEKERSDASDVSSEW